MEHKNDLIPQLAGDPKYMARRQAQLAEAEAAERRGREVEAPVFADLRRVGVEVDSLWGEELVESATDDCVEVLLSHLRGSYPDRTLEGLARGLSNVLRSQKRKRKLRKARRLQLWAELKPIFVANPDPTAYGSKFAVALAMSVVAEKAVAHELLELLADDSQGLSRAALLLAVGVAGDAAEPVLQSMVDHPGLGPEVRHRLGILQRRMKRKG